MIPLVWMLGSILQTDFHFCSLRWHRSRGLRYRLCRRKPSGSREKDNAGFVNEQASKFMGWVQHSADGVQSEVAQLGDAARSLGEEAERRGNMLVNQVMTIPGQSANFFSSFSSRLEQLASKPRDDGILSILSNLFETEEKKEWEDPNLSSTMYVQVQPTRTSAPRGKVFSSSLRKMLGDLAYPQISLTDEIVPIIHLTVDFTHKVFLAMVHCYLVLLLIVSLPASKGTRTRLIVKHSGSRRKRQQEVSIGKLVLERHMVHMLLHHL
jgi:hypothetical protein